MHRFLRQLVALADFRRLPAPLLCAHAMALATPKRHEAIFPCQLPIAHRPHLASLGKFHYKQHVSLASGARGPGACRVPRCRYTCLGRYRGPGNR